MALLDRDKIWYTAWALVPVALVVNVLIGFSYEKAHRYEWQAGAQARAGRWAEAAETYARAAEAEPGMVRFAYNAGAAYRIAGDLERARHWNAEALRIDPGFQLALQERRLIHEAAQATGQQKPAPTIEWRQPDVLEPGPAKPR